MVATAERQQRPVLKGRQARAAFAQIHQRTEAWVAQSAQTMAQENGHPKVTRADRTQALMYVLGQRLAEEGRVATPATKPTETAQTTGRRRVADAATQIRERARKVINDNHFGNHAISWTLAHILAGGSEVLGYRNNVLRTYLTRVDHEAVYGAPQPMGRFKKGTMHAIELVPIVGDAINALGALRGRHNFVGRRLDAPGRVIEALGVIPVVNASLVHDARAKTEDIVYRRLEARAAKAAAGNGRRKAA